MFSSQARFNLLFSSAIVEGRILPYFQPIVSLQNASITGFEVLARWREPGLGVISPTIFIPLAERGGMLDELMISLMRQTFSVAKNWPEELSFAFNVSPSQLHWPNLLDRINLVTAEFEFSPSRLFIEITETALLKDRDNAKYVVEKLISIGCSISLDDFGTGYSSLTWLITFPFSKIKIDASFVGRMLEQRENRKIVTAVVGLGQSLGLSVIAEGVETVEEANFLRAIGCSFAQGYLFGRPMPADEVANALLHPIDVTLSADPLKMSLEQRSSQIAALYHAEDTSIGFLDANLIVVDASEVFANRVGKPRSAVIGHHISDVLPMHEDRINWLKSFRLRGLPYPTFEIALPTKGTDLVSVQSVKDETGDLLGFSIVGIDITARKLAEDALRESEERYRIAAMLSPCVSWQTDMLGNLLSIDARFAERVGITLAEAVGTNWLQLVAPDDRDRVQTVWTSAITTGDVYNEEQRYRMADGSFRWFHTYLAPRIKPDGEILLWFGQSQDIDARKRTEEELRDRDVQFQFIIDNCPHLPVATDLNGVVLSISPALAPLFRSTTEELSQRDAWLEFVNESQRPTVRAHWLHCFASGHIFDMDFQLNFQDEGERWVHGWFAPRQGVKGEILGWYGTMSELRLPRLHSPTLPSQGTD